MAEMETLLPDAGPWEPLRENPSRISWMGSSPECSSYLIPANEHILLAKIFQIFSASGRHLVYKILALTVENWQSQKKEKLMF